MNGQMKKYSESLSQTPGPVPPESIPKVKIDYEGLISYARDKGVTPAELSFEESARYMTELVPGEMKKVREISEINAWESIKKKQPSE